jgi:hypothetical protein
MPNQSTSEIVRRIQEGCKRLAEEERVTRVQRGEAPRFNNSDEVLALFNGSPPTSEEIGKDVRENASR